MANKTSNGFLLTSKFYKGENNGALLDPKKHEPEQK